MTVLLAFTLEQASRVTRVPERRIRYWDNTGILNPSLSSREDGGAYSRIYSFRDLVGLWTIAELRDRFGVSLQRLRGVAERLRKHADTPWSELRFYASGRHLFFRDPESDLLLSALNPGQLALIESLDLISVARDTEKRAMTLTRRTPDQVGQITQNRYIANNRPVIAGTRIPTAAIWDFHEAGYSNAEIIKEYPRLSPADVDAAMEYEKKRAATGKRARGQTGELRWRWEQSSFLRCSSTSVCLNRSQTFSRLEGIRYWSLVRRFLLARPTPASWRPRSLGAPLS